MFICIKIFNLRPISTCATLWYDSPVLWIVLSISRHSSSVVRKKPGVTKSTGISWNFYMFRKGWNKKLCLESCLVLWRTVLDLPHLRNLAEDILDLKLTFRPHRHHTNNKGIGASQERLRLCFQKAVGTILIFEVTYCWSTRFQRHIDIWVAVIHTCNQDQ
jgi:hypothetical protein